MADTIKPLFERKVGHLPLRAVVSESAHGGSYVVSCSIGDKEYLGKGTTVRLAQQDLKRQLDEKDMGKGYRK